MLARGQRVTRKNIDEANARRLAVAADCDPRTIKKVLRGDDSSTIAAQRARKALRDAGYLDGGK